MDPLRPSVSRETRLLLTIIVISVALLWVLARIRFPGKAASPSPVSPVLAQLAPPSAFEDITSTVAQLTPHISELISVIAVSAETAAGPRSTTAQALQVRDGLAIALTGERVEPRSTDGASIEITARDPATGLTLLRVPAEDAAAPEVWSSRGLQYPRFLIASDVSTGNLSLRPVFIGSLNSIASPRWAGSLWAVPDGAGLRAGTFLFTVAGELAGVTINHADHVAIVPGELLMNSVDRLSRQPHPNHASLGAEVQALTPALAAALQAQNGVVVTWVDPAGPAAGLLSAMDVIARVNGNAVSTPDQWDDQVLALAEGSAVALDVQRQGKAQQIQVTARPTNGAADDPVLGLTLRALPRVGVEVLHVVPRSAAAGAGIRAGDIITKAGSVDAPSSGQISRLFSENETLVFAVTRDQDHRVLAIEKAR